MPQVTLNGTIFKPLTGDFAGEIFRFKSWFLGWSEVCRNANGTSPLATRWVVEDETLIIRLFKRRLFGTGSVGQHLFQRNSGSNGSACQEL